jgi:hypothetical protein
MHLLGPVGLVIVGLLGLIGGLLPWVSVSTTFGGLSQSVQGGSLLPGSSDWKGPGAAALGALILLCAAAFLFGRRNRTVLGVTTVLSAILLGFGVYNVIDVYRQANDLYNRMNSGFSFVPRAATGGQLLDVRNFLHIDPAPGLWMVAIGGLIGSALSVFVWRGQRSAAGMTSAQAQPVALAPFVQQFVPPPLYDPTGSLRAAEPPKQNP